LSWQGLNPIKLAYDPRLLDDHNSQYLYPTRHKGSMPAVLVKESLLLHRTHHFFPVGGWDHHQYSLHHPQRELTHLEEWPGWIDPSGWL